MKFIYSAFAACALFCTAPQVLAGAEAPTSVTPTTTNLRVGIETAKLYPVAFLQALQTHAGKPLLIISSADVEAIIPPILDKPAQLDAFTNYLRAQGVDRLQLVTLSQKIRKDMPSQLEVIYGDFAGGATHRAQIVAFSGTEGGVIIIPPRKLAEFTQSLSRFQTRYTVPIPEEERKRWLAAHEASHIKFLTRDGKDDQGYLSEANADTEAMHFVARYPQFFPHLSKNPEHLEQIRMLRALSSVAGIPTTFQYQYSLSALCANSRDHCSYAELQDMHQSYDEAENATAELMYQRGILAADLTLTKAEALDNLERKFMSFRIGVPLNLAADRSGVLADYFRKTGITDLASADAKYRVQDMFSLEGADYASGRGLRERPELSANQWDRIITAAMTEARKALLRHALQKYLNKAADGNTISLCRKTNEDCDVQNQNEEGQMIEIIRNRPSFHDTVIACMKEIVTRSPRSQNSLPERAKLYLKRVVEGARLFGRPAATCTKD